MKRGVILASGGLGQIHVGFEELILGLRGRIQATRGLNSGWRVERPKLGSERPVLECELDFHSILLSFFSRVHATL